MSCSHRWLTVLHDNLAIACPSRDRGCFYIVRRLDNIFTASSRQLSRVRKIPGPGRPIGDHGHLQKPATRANLSHHLQDEAFFRAGGAEMRADSCSLQIDACKRRLTVAKKASGITRRALRGVHCQRHHTTCHGMALIH